MNEIAKHRSTSYRLPSFPSTTAGLLTLILVLSTQVGANTGTASDRRDLPKFEEIQKVVVHSLGNRQDDDNGVQESPPVRDESDESGSKQDPESKSQDEAQNPPPADGSNNQQSADDAEREQADKDWAEKEQAEEDEAKEDRGAARRSRNSRLLQFSKLNDQIQTLLADQVRSVANSTVEVYVNDNDSPSALGMIVDSKGFAMTKASMLKGAVRCKLANGRMVPAIVYGVDTDTDLALLRLQATNLSPIPWSLQPEQEALEGYWVLTPGIDGSLRSLGVVSVAPRKIPSASGFIGIQMQPHDQGVEVTQVIRGTAADRFGLKTSDVITTVDEQSVAEPSDLSSALRGKRPGDVVSLTVTRGSTELALRVVLGNREEDNPDNQRSVNQNTMSGDISKRRDDFPIVLQHDSYLAPEECGGPLVDLDGRVVGLNISRAGRVNSYALPVSLVQSVFERLLTGEFSPEVVFSERLQGYENVILSLNVAEVKLTTERSELEQEMEQRAKSAKATQGEITSLEQQLEALKKQIEQKSQGLDAVETERAQLQSKIRSKEREIERNNEQKKDVEKEKKELLFGAS